MIATLIYSKTQYSMIKQDVLRAVLDNRFTQQQASGAAAKREKTFPRKYLIYILDHAVCDERRSFGCIYRDILALSIALGARPTAMWKVTTDQIKELHWKTKNVYMYTKIIGFKTVESNMKRGGTKYISLELVQISLFDFHLLDGLLNVYKMYDNLLSVRLEFDSQRLFLQINRNKTKNEAFFTRQHISMAFSWQGSSDNLRWVWGECFGWKWLHKESWSTLCIYWALKWVILIVE